MTNFTRSLLPPQQQEAVKCKRTEFVIHEYTSNQISEQDISLQTTDKFNSKRFFIDELGRARYENKPPFFSWLLTPLRNLFSKPKQ